MERLAESKNEANISALIHSLYMYVSFLVSVQDFDSSRKERWEGGVMVNLGMKAGELRVWEEASFCLASQRSPKMYRCNTYKNINTLCSVLPRTKTTVRGGKVHTPSSVNVHQQL